jgi:hypothetical protein
MPPATGGGPDAGSNLCRPELGVADADVAAGIVLPARSPATEPTARSADTACSVAAGDGSAGWAAQRPSALTISSAPTGPCGPRLIPLLAVGRAQSGLANSSTGLENQPPSFWSSNTRAAPVHPPTPSAAAQASAMLKRAKWAELRNKRASPNRFISLSLKHILRHHRGSGQASIVQRVIAEIGHWPVVHWPSRFALNLDGQGCVRCRP